MSGNGVGERISRNERTPLLQTVPVTESRGRYPHQKVRRCCTITLAAIPTLAIAVGLVLWLIGGSRNASEPQGPDNGIPHSSWPESEGLSYKELKKIFKQTPNTTQLRQWSQYYTSGPHLAGKNLSQAEWTRDRWEEFGVKSSVVAYDVYINYPISNGLSLLEHDEVKFRATLTEDVLEEDPTSGLKDRIPVFHGYSANGDVTAPFVYCNYGTFEDFEELQKANISLAGKIAVIKYGDVFRGLKVKRAEDLGMVGVVIYTDPGDDGVVTEHNGYKAYPHGPARNPSSVQRGSVEYLSLAPGDPTTIGYPSKPDAPRMSPDNNIPKIPSLPLSYAEAVPILKALNGHGPNATSFPKSWQSGGLGYKGVQYSIGPSPDTLTLHLQNKQEYAINPIWNVIGVINGTIADEVVVIGNHRDAWIAGGAGDPNSGSAALNEVIASFGAALKKGWKPLRTIVFASWDGEEYGLIGSTEWVEEYIPWLSEAAIAYINVDIAAVGSTFSTAAAPLLNKAIIEVLGQVQSPNQTVKGATIKDNWSGVIATIGSGSDFTAFQDFVGIPSIDVSFKPAPGGPVYHYHSNYDSFHWMDKYGDPGFEYQRAIAVIINLLAAKLVEAPLIPFNTTDYAAELKKYLASAKKLSDDSMISLTDETKASLDSLEHALDSLLEASIAFEARAQRLEHELHTKSSVTSALFHKARTINTKYKLLERQFCYTQGLDGRSWFKHVVFAPGLWTGYAGATFPGLMESIESKNQSSIQRWADIIEQRVDGAIGLLKT